MKKINSVLIKNAILNNKVVNVLIENNVITKISSNLDYKTSQIIDCQKQKAILPGFINFHTHSGMSYFRGFGADLPLEKWLKEKIWPKEELLTADDIYWGSLFSFVEMIKSGITTINEMYSFRESQIKALETLPMRALIGLVIFDHNQQSTIQEAKKILAKYQDNLPNYISFSLAPHSIYTVSSENLILVSQFAKKNDLPIHLHLSETQIEVDNCLKQHQMRPVEFLESLNFFENNRVFLAHTVHLTKKEAKILAKYNVSLIYNPCSNLKLNSGLFNFSLAKENNLNICLGTDSVSSNNSLNFFEEMKFAILSQNLTQNHQLNTRNQPTQTISNNEIYQTTTLNGAKALKIKSGLIMEGKLADLILVDLNHYSLIPNHDLISNLIFSANPECVTDVVINGEIIMKNRFIEMEEKIKREFKKRILRVFNER